MFKSGWAKITRAGNSAANWFTQQITYKGNVSESAIVFPYGFHANATVNDSIVVWIGVAGNAENKAGIAFQPNIRPDLLEGEVAVYQPASNTIIKFLQDESIVVITDNKIDVTAPIVNITGDVNIAGNTVMTGNLTVTGSTTLSATVTSNAKDIGDNHGHDATGTYQAGGDAVTGTSGKVL